MSTTMSRVQHIFDDVLQRYVCVVCKRHLDFWTMKQDIARFVDLLKNDEELMERTHPVAAANCCGKHYTITLTASYK